MDISILAPDVNSKYELCKMLALTSQTLLQITILDRDPKIRDYAEILDDCVSRIADALNVEDFEEEEIDFNQVVHEARNKYRENKRLFIRLLQANLDRCCLFLKNIMQNNEEDIEQEDDETQLYFALDDQIYLEETLHMIEDVKNGCTSLQQE